MKLLTPSRPVGQNFTRAYADLVAPAEVCHAFCTINFGAVRRRTVPGLHRRTTKYPLQLPISL